MTITKAITMLISEYEKAERKPHVRNPIAYALHKVWQKADEEGRANE